MTIETQQGGSPPSSDKSLPSGGFSPLKGVRVVELSHMIFGPACGMFLAFLGAEVIKVEPVGGDKTRQLTGMGASFFALFNRGKKSVVLDLGRDEGREALDRLMASADILVENFRDGTLAGMGLELSRFRARFPELITVSCKGFLDGPYSDRPALDETVQMMTGLAHMTGPTGMPLRVGSSANDIMAGLAGAYSAVAALRERETTGAGREIRVGLFENSLLLVAQHMVQFALTGREPAPMPEREFTWPVYDIFVTRDDRKLFIGAVTSGHWVALCKLLGLEKFLEDPAIKDRMDQINAREWTLPEFRAAVAGWSSSDLMRELESRMIPFAPVTTPAEMYDDPQAIPSLVESLHADGTTIRAPGYPVQIDRGRVVPPMDIPGLGVDGAEILAGLGFDADAARRASGSDSG